MGHRVKPTWEAPDNTQAQEVSLLKDEAEVGLDNYYHRLMVWPTGDLTDPVKKADPTRVAGIGDGVLIERDARWRALRLQWVREHGQCAVCGGTRNLEVHHKMPFHLFPSLELERSNLMTLCQGGRGVNCHFIAGHGCDWSRYVKEPELVAAHMRLHIFVELQPATRLLLTDAIKKVLGGRLLRQDPSFSEEDTKA